MSKWDYVPGVSNIKGAIQGRPGQAFLGPLDPLAKDAEKHFFTDPANEVKGAYDQALGQSSKDEGALKDFYMGQQAKAQGFYKPLQQMFNTSYGTGGIQAPQLPTQQVGKPLKSMYGGG